MNFSDKTEFARLTNAAKESKRKLEPFREKRKELISMFAGSEYSADGEARKVYLNLIALATNIYVRQCAVRAPTARIGSPYMDLRALASELEISCKLVAKEVELGTLLRRAVTDAIFSPKATVKIGLKRAGMVERYGVQVDVTEPWVELVSFDDYVCDMSARSAYNPAFEGNTYYMSLDEVMKQYPRAKRLHLAASDLGMQNDGGGDRAESLSHTPNIGDNDFQQKITLQDLYLKKEGLLVTYALEKPELPLDVVDFDVSSKGPYRGLWFTDVPDNAMPLPPFSLLRNINELANSLFRRMAAQARAHKRVVGFSDEESANRFGKTHDGHGVYWDGQPPMNLEAGGLDPRNMAFFIQVKDIFSWAAGNLDSLGGLSAMSETIGQDEMLSQSASAQLADMQDASADFAEAIFRDLALYEWTDPVRERMLEKPIPGDLGMTLVVPWTPETRQGNFLDMNFKIIPQSMREDSPSIKVQKLNAVLQQTILPMMPLFEQQGMTIDVRRFLAIIGDYSNLPELEEVIVSMSEEQQQARQPVGNPEPSVMPANTTRTYERVNRPGATRVGKDFALAQTLMGAGVQDADAANMFKGVS